MLLKADINQNLFMSDSQSVVGFYMENCYWKVYTCIVKYDIATAKNWQVWLKHTAYTLVYEISILSRHAVYTRKLRLWLGFTVANMIVWMFMLYLEWTPDKLSGSL